MSLALSLDPAHCLKLFTGSNGANEWNVYVDAFCKAEKVILAGDPDSAGRLLVFNANQATWNDLHAAGAASNIQLILRNSLGLSQVQAELATADVVTAVWWADAMAAYSKALAQGQSLEAAGRQVVRDSNLGFNAPWMLLAIWDLTGAPAVQAEFVIVPPKTMAAAG